MAVQCNPLFTGFFIAAAMMNFFIAEAINYNREIQTCCGATLFEKGNFTGCCGKGPYIDTEAICCGDRVFQFRELSIASHTGILGCCFSSSDGGKPFDRSTHECCDGEVMEKPDKNVFYGCCSGKLYDGHTKRCCDHQLYDQTEGNECCGDKIYNTSSQICCQRWERKGDEVVREFAELHNLQGHESSCCGRVVYDTTKDACCSDKVLPKPNGLKREDALCCEGKVVDNRNQLCCRSYSNLTGTSPNLEGKAFDRVGIYSKCCGLTAFDIRHQVCCNDTLSPKPAGIEEYAWGTCCGEQIQTSFRSQICINNKLVERNSTDLWNCGEDGRLYSIHKQTCCFGEILENTGDTKCCFTAEKTYDSKKEICCASGIQSLTAEDIRDGKIYCCDE